MSNSLVTVLIALVCMSQSNELHSIFKVFDELQVDSEQAMILEQQNIEVLVDEDRRLVVKMNKDQQELRLPMNQFWGQPKFSKNGRYLSILSNEGTDRSYSPIGAYLIDLSSGKDSAAKKTRFVNISKEIDFSKSKFGELKIVEVLAISNDGNKLLCRCHFSFDNPNVEGEKLAIYRPFLVDLGNKIVSPFELK